jgi:hypothetical protein
MEDELDSALLRTECNLNYIERPSPYRAVNTFRLGYKNQSVNAV